MGPGTGSGGCPIRVYSPLLRRTPNGASSTSRPVFDHDQREECPWHAQILSLAGLLALTAVATGVRAMHPSLTRLTPRPLDAGLGTLVKLDWSVESRSRWGPPHSRYVTNTSGEAAEPLRLLAQALDASGAVVGQQIAWVPEASVDSSARTSRSRICRRQTITACPCGTTRSWRLRPRDCDRHRGGRAATPADVAALVSAALRCLRAVSPGIVTASSPGVRLGSDTMRRSNIETSITRRPRGRARWLPLARRISAINSDRRRRRSPGRQHQP